MNLLIVEDIIKRAINEDMNYGDITTDSLISDALKGEAVITAKEKGVIAGLEVAARVFQILDSSISFMSLIKDGELVEKGQDLAIVKGTLKNIIKGERIALNLIQRMSGIATKTYQLKERVKGIPVKIVDTRKTTPGLRILEKYAVVTGGGNNHRYNLSDMVLIKDNHIKAVGTIREAVDRCRKTVSHTIKIEVEVTNLEELREALDAEADIILLDNMDIDTMRKAVEITGGKALLEASGNIIEDNIRQVAATGVDIISVGALTHSVKALDISLNIVKK